MPWTVADVDKFKKGLTEQEKERWVRIANAALAKCLDGDGDELDCEVKAIRQANGAFSEEKPDLTNFSNPLKPENHDETVRLTLADVDDVEDPSFQLAFPIGAFRTAKYGEIIVTRTFAKRMHDNWKAGVLGKRAVYMDTNHDFGEACAWAEDMRVTDDGLEVKWDFNSKGRELVSDRRYRFYSAAIGWAINIETGDEAYPVLYAVSLTNDPVMNTMPEAHLSDQRTDSAQSDGEKNITGGDTPVNTLSEILEALFSLGTEEREKATDEQRDKIAKFFGIKLGDGSEAEVKLTEAKQALELKDEKLALVLDENKELSKKLADIQAKQLATRKAEVIEKALSEGKILPKNREKWEGMFDKDPDGTADLLAEKGSEVDLGEVGKGTGGAETTLTDDDRDAFEVFRKINWNLSEEDAKAEWAKINGGNE